MANRKVVLDVSDSVIAGAVLGSFPLDKSNRLIEAHATDKDKVVVKGSNLIPMRIGTSWFLIDTDTNVSTATDMDTGTISNGRDYCVYACDNSGTLVFKISLATTYPSGFSASTSRKIGGFHTLCASVGTISGHTLTGYTANQILPASVWDLKHRPLSEPAGMVFSEAANLWVDIYLASGSGASTTSAYGGTISDTRNWMDFVDDFGAVRKKLLDDSEFQVIAAGSNEETNIAGTADPVTTGGHSDTAGRRMISNIGCEDCCGVMWQWLRDQSTRFDVGGGWGYYNLPGSKGSLYNYNGTSGQCDVKLLAGAIWDSGTNAGSRSRFANIYRWGTHSSIGGRGRSEPL